MYRQVEKVSYLCHALYPSLLRSPALHHCYQLQHELEYLCICDCSCALKMLPYKPRTYFAILFCCMISRNSVCLTTAVLLSFQLIYGLPAQEVDALHFFLFLIKLPNRRPWTKSLYSTKKILLLHSHTLSRISIISEDCKTIQGFAFLLQFISLNDLFVS